MRSWVRMIADVLVEPRKEDIPIKRRKSRAKRMMTKTTDLGKIKNYFSTIYQRKDWTSDDMKEVGAGATARKRKGGGCMEQPEELLKAKSRRTMVEETNLCGIDDSGTLSPTYLGAKSLEGREPVDRQMKKERAGFKEINGGNRQRDVLIDQDKTKIV